MADELEGGLSRREFLRLAAIGTVAAGMGAEGARAAEEALTATDSAAPRAVWALSKAYQEATPTRGRVCINGLWRWQPGLSSYAGEGGAAESVPSDGWGYFKVPGPWPGLAVDEAEDCQVAVPHASWRDANLGEAKSAWYQREITVPKGWAGRRIALHLEYLNSYAAVYVDGKKVGEVRFPAGEVDLTAVCPAGSKHVLSLFVLALPHKGVTLSFTDTNAAKAVEGSVGRRGLCGDAFLVSTPTGACLTDVMVETSVRKGAITFRTALRSLSPRGRYSLRARIMEKGRTVKTFTSPVFTGTEAKRGRFAFTQAWKPEKLWDLHTPQHQYRLNLSLVDAAGRVLDVALPMRFGFREFWIDGRDLYLNGSRIYLAAVPLNNNEMGTAWATYEASKETLLRLKSFGTNFVYTHNYDCEPGSHLSFADTLRAADDVGMLVALTQPHFGHYDWDKPDSAQRNGYAGHAAFYAQVAGNHPSVVCYATSHNATGTMDDTSPDRIDGRERPLPDWVANSLKAPTAAEAIIRRLDPTRVVYHHSSGGFGAMYTLNFYLNFAPIQEVSDWFEHWATEGVRPLFTCEYCVPGQMDWTTYRGWYHEKRSFGSAVVPWELCVAEWDAQFLGDAAYRINEAEKRNLRWEAQKFRGDTLWHRWDYPYPLDSRAFGNRHPVYARYTTENWRAFRTWGLSGSNHWEYWLFWDLREGADRGTKQFRTDWDTLQRPGYSPDRRPRAFDMIDTGYQRSDWLPTVASQAFVRNNRPLLAYLGGKPSAFTSQDHNFRAGEVVEKQLILINNSRVTATCDCQWTLALPQPVRGSAKITVRTGEQHRIPLRFALPTDLAPGRYELSATVTFDTGAGQNDTFALHVLPAAGAAPGGVKVALFDPKGETRALLDAMGMSYQMVGAEADLAGYDVLVVGKAALTREGAAPDIGRVREGLRVVMFEQAPEVLEKRFGFRIAEYGMRQVFRRVPDHPLLTGLEEAHLQDWRGAATLLPSRLTYELGPRYAPTVKWCDIDVTRLWRCGNRGNVASALIEKPVRGDFLPVLDSGFGLQYSPLLEYREGQGLILFCQCDVTGRSEADPAAETLARNVMRYASTWQPSPRRTARYVGDAAGRRHLEEAGVRVADYKGGALAAGEALVVGAGGGQQLRAQASAIAEFVKRGGHVLGLGLSGEEASAFLPFSVQTKDEEHIAAHFEAFGHDSLLAGVSPADVHNRDPRPLPLVTGGATVVGNGVLAQAERGHVVFWQFPPYTVASDAVREANWRRDGIEQYGLKKTYRRTSFTLTRLLANMGVAGETPILERFHQPVAAAERRWLEGMYLDQPEEWDDPYRFFGW